MCFSLDVSAVFIYQITKYVGVISSISFSLFTGFSTLISFFVDRLICIFELEIMIVRSRLRKRLHIFFCLQLIFLEVRSWGNITSLLRSAKREYVFQLQFSIFLFLQSLPSFFLSLYVLFSFAGLYIHKLTYNAIFNKLRGRLHEPGYLGA